jgi:hypothetical protein
MTITSTKGVVVNHAQGLVFDSVRVKPAKGPVFDFSNASDVKVRNGAAPAGTEVFLKLEGTNSTGVVIESSDLSAAARPVAMGNGLASGAVEVKP